MSDIVLDSARAAVTVEIPVARAFEVFTAQMGSWWPESHHVCGVPQEMVVEPYAGGRVYDRYADGKEAQWGSVIAYEPPTLLKLRWHLDGTFAFDPDPNHASVVEIRFIAEGEGKTRVELEHHGFERHLQGGDAVREAVNSPGGWMLGLNAFVAFAGKK